MVVRITPPGGRVRRKGGAISLAGGDVPTVAPARDPGVNVPLIPIPAGDTGGVIGAGLQSLGNVLGEGANLALQVVQRNEGLARDADETSFSDTLQDTIRDLQATACCLFIVACASLCLAVASASASARLAAA